MTALRTVILKNLTLAQIEGGEDFTSVAEWLEFANDQDIQAAAESAGLISAPTYGELCETIADQRRAYEGRLDRKDAAL